MISLRRTLTVLIALAVVGLAGACSDDSADKADSTTTTAADSSSGDDGETSGGDFTEDFVAMLTGEQDAAFTEEQAQCVADKLDSELSEQGKKDAVAPDKDIEDLAEEDLAISLGAFDECVTVEEFAEVMSRQLGAEGTDEQRACVISSITEQYESSGQLIREMMSSSTDENSDLAKVFAQCVLEGEGGIATVLKSEMIKQGLTEEQAECVANAVAASVTAEQITAPTMSPEVTAAIAAASQQCVGGG